MKLLNVAWLTLFFVNFESCHQTTTRISNAEKVFNVTLVIFSGRRDPTWLIASTTNAPLFNQVQNALKAGQGLDPSQMPARLGYKGFLVRAKSDEKEYLILGKSTITLQKALLDSIPPRAIPKKLRSNLAKKISTVKPLTISHSHEITKRKATIYNGATRKFWNRRFVRINNNCYNYATNKDTYTFAQPGRGTGRMYTQYERVHMKNAARRDGLILYHYNDEFNPPPIPRHSTRHLVALFVAPGMDHHWYRLDSNGMWSHKRGGTEATNRDDSDNLIDDPRFADTGYYDFVAFMLVDEKTVNIR